MLGTLVNAATVIVGSTVGLLLRDRLPEKVTRAVFGALGLFTLYTGVSMGLESNNPLVLIFSLLIGVVVGELIDLDRLTAGWVDKLQARSKGDVAARRNFTDGLLTAFVLFCVGAMTLLGCIREGLTGERDIIFTKAFMDLFSSMALASAFGRGVLFAVIPLVIYQGSITLLAGHIKPFMTEAITAEMVGVGGVLLIGLGLNILKITELKLLNFIPALFIAPVVAWISEQF